ncbi:hypothetical protein ACFPN7_10045 [Amycolatopsis halotolerans]|uniref:hypothetical protein n=1 Tax=Amycolatopsis halotolerans TaxID=330083 RepID=UPI0036109405
MPFPAAPRLEYGGNARSAGVLVAVAGKTAIGEVEPMPAGRLFGAWMPLVVSRVRRRALPARQERRRTDET